MTIEKYFERRIHPEVEQHQQEQDDDIYKKKSHCVSTSSSTIKPATYNQSCAIIDEDQLARTFQEIVNCINLDGDDEANVDDIEHNNNISCNISSNTSSNISSNTSSNISGNTSSNTCSNNFSRSDFHHSHHTLLPEFKSIFGTNFNMAVGTSGPNSSTCSKEQPQQSTISSSRSLGKSFLDEDWMSFGDSDFKKGPLISSAASSVSVSSSTSTSTLNSTSSTRPITPASNSSYFSNTHGTHGTHGSHGTHGTHGPHGTHGTHGTYNTPPNDYLCKLCNRDGHWMKDCRLFEPRNSPASLSSFKSNFSSNSSLSSLSSGSSGVFSSGRTLLPPGNYVCRLCNVAGHWIDQCIKFQPKDALNTSTNSGPNNTGTAPSLPPMLGPGPTPNYRPPAYLSKPVPSNYLCNLCNRPGHWIQQCTEFTPIINTSTNANANVIKRQ